MLAWIALKTFLKKTWVWLRHNWYVPAVLVYTIVLWVLFSKRDRAREVLEVRANSYQEQIDTINKLHKEEVEKRNEIIAEYEKIVERLEKEYKEKEEKLSSEKKKEVKELAEKYYNKPDELAKILADKFGFEHKE